MSRLDNLEETTKNLKQGMNDIAQKLDFEAQTLESTFDTTIFGLTVIPIVGWFKLLPTFGGRVVTEADGLAFDSDTRTLRSESRVPPGRDAAPPSRWTSPV